MEKDPPKGTSPAAYPTRQDRRKRTNPKTWHLATVYLTGAGLGVSGDRD
jgi:hypothetical protein